MTTTKQVESRTLRSKGRCLRQVRLGGLPRFVSLDQQLVTHFGPALKDGVGRQFDHALGTKVGPSYFERANQLPQTDYLEIVVDQDEVKWEQHSDAVNCVCRDNPHAAVRLKRSLAQQANQPAHNGVGDCDPKSEKSLLRLVIHKHIAVFSRHGTPSCVPTRGYLPRSLLL